MLKKLILGYIMFRENIWDILSIINNLILIDNKIKIMEVILWHL